MMDRPSYMMRQIHGRSPRMPPTCSRPNAVREEPWTSRVTYEAHIPQQLPPASPQFSRHIVVHYTHLHRPWDADIGGAPATGWIVAGPGIWEYRTRALAMIDYHGAQGDYSIDVDASPEVDEEIQNTNLVRAMACGIRLMGPMVVWRCVIDQSQLVQGPFLYSWRHTVGCLPPNATRRSSISQTFV